MKQWRMRWVGHVECMVGKRNEYCVLVVKPKERCWCRWEDNVERYVKEIGPESMD